MIIVDVETTGTNPEIHSLVSIGAIDLSKPDIQFSDECRVWDGAHIDDEALKVNGFSREQVSDPQKKTEKEMVELFLAWLEERGDMIILGQNVFFDVEFIKEGANRGGLANTLSRRIVDMHSICFAHMIRRGIVPPTLNRKTALDSDRIMEYVGIPKEPKPHRALNGALWEAEAFSRLLFDKILFSQFSTFPIPWSKNA